MKVFIVAIPLFDYQMSVQAYRLCDRSADKALGIKNDFRGMSEVFLSPGLNLIEAIGPEPFSGNKPLFADINRFQLLTDVPTNMHIQAEKLVCVLPASMQVEDIVVEKCANLGQKGYTIALDGFPVAGLQSPLVQFADYLILDYTSKSFAADYETMSASLPHITVVVGNVPDAAAFDALSSNHKALFSGGFYNQPITKGNSEISPIKVNALQLLNQVNQPDFELEDIGKIIKRDPSLSISLLRFINSAALGLSRSVNSISSAIAILGQLEVRRWATVAISISLAEDRPGEITKLSLVRAKFAENLANAFELGVFQSSLFITGLFSLLDVILQKPMEQAIKEVAVNERVQQALVAHAGPLYPVMDLIYTYERADWDRVSILMIQNNIDIEAVNEAFIEALVWFNQLLATIDNDA